MHASTLQGFLGHLRRLTDPTRSRELSDADLLERFRLRREEAAFTLVVQRHGPMVLAVCRRLLGNTHDAEDAFQATFLVLIRKAGSIHKQQSLGAWLHRVACRLALKARSQSARRRLHESEIIPPPLSEDCLDTLAAREALSALDEEIECLPEKYRMPVILCYLSDKTHEQAACTLGCPKSSVTSRLARARELLQQRLNRRGFAVPGGLMAMLLADTTADAAVPSLLTLSTVRLAVQARTGETLAAALAGSFVTSTAAAKLGAVLALLATLGLAAIGYRMSLPASPSQPEKSASKSPALGEPSVAKAEPRTPRVDLLGDPLPVEVVARMGSGRLRHFGYNRRSLFFSTDGKQIVSSVHEGLRIWDAATGKLVRRFEFGWGIAQTSCRYVGDSIISVDIGPHQNAAVAVHILDAATGRERRQVRIKERAVSVVDPILSPDGKLLAVAHQNDIGVYDTNTGERIQSISFKGVAAWDIAFAPDSKTLAFNNLSTDTIFLHDASTGKLIRELKRPGDTTLHVVFSPDGRFLASMPQSNPRLRKGDVSIWNLRDGKEIHRWTHPFPMAMSAVFSPDGKYVAIGGARWGGVVRDVETGKEVYRLSPHGGVCYIAFSPDGKMLAAASPRGAIRLWDAATGKLLPASADPDVQLVDDLHFSADGKCLLGDAGACLVWDSESGRELNRFADPKPLDFSRPNDMRCLVLSPDETLLAACGSFGTITLCDAATGKEKRSMKVQSSVWKPSFTPDGRQLISSSGDDTIRLWDVETGRELHRLPGRTPAVVSPDGRHLAAADAKKPMVYVYDLTTGAEMKHFAFPQPGMAGGSALVWGLSFAPDGRSLAAVGYLRQPTNPGLIMVWDLTEGGRVRSFDSRKKPVQSVAFSPDGRTLATGGSWGELILWEMSSGRPRHVFTGHENEIHSLAFSPDGRTLAASSVEAPVYVWDVAGALESKPHSLSNGKLQRYWTALASDDASAAFQALRLLAAAPAQTLPFLRDHLKPALSPDLKRIRQLVEMLDSDDFPKRQQAAEELAKQANAAGLLRQIMAKEKPSLEVRRRLQQIAEGIENKPESLRAVRAVEVLEWIATPDAVSLLGELSHGAADARLTREAVAAKKRFQR